MVYSTRLFVLSLALFYFVIVLFSSFSITITTLGEERANLSALRTFVRFAATRFVVCLALCHFVLVFFSPFSIAITSLGE